MKKWIILFLMTLILAFEACEQNKFQDGKALYQSQCAHCHMADGTGLGDAIPALGKANLTARKEQIPCIIRKGIQGQVMIMPGHPKLNEVEISNIIHYLFEELAKQPIQWSIKDISSSLKECD